MDHNTDCRYWAYSEPVSELSCWPYWSALKPNKPPIRTPTGMSLADAVSVKFADSEPVSVAYKTCGPANCIGEVAFSEAWLKAFRSSPSFAVTYTLVNGKKFEQEISLKGFSDAFNYYTEQAAADANQ